MPRRKRQEYILKNVVSPKVILDVELKSFHLLNAVGYPYHAELNVSDYGTQIFSSGRTKKEAVTRCLSEMESKRWFHRFLEEGILLRVRGCGVHKEYDPLQIFHT